MNKLYAIAAYAVLFTACSEENIVGPQEPVTPGTEVGFSISLDKTVSRTLYGSETDGAFPIYWVNDDKVLITSPQCLSGHNMATYSVAVEGSNQNYATAMNKVGDSGIQWGDSETNNFYSIYPVQYNSDATTVVKNTLTPSGDGAVARLNVRSYQTNIFTKDANGVWQGTPIDHNAEVKNPDAIMYAQKKHTGGGDVALQYVPFTTAFHVTIGGYDLSDDLGKDPQLTIEEVIIEAPAETALCGSFNATFDADCTTAPGITAVSTSNIIHVPTWVGDRFLRINQNENIEFNVFAIPTDGTFTDDWTITVKTSSGTFRRTLSTLDGKKNLAIGKIHKLPIPGFTISTGFEFDFPKWMSQIPRNVYLSELSIPGAWYGTTSEYQGNNVSYASLWNAGVRAFGIETRSAGMGMLSNPGTPAQVVVSGTGRNQTLGGGYYGGTAINTVMSNIIAQLKAANPDVNNPTEYAVLVLSYADGGEGGHRERDYAFWLKGIYEEFNTLSSDDKDWIYQTAITPNTTVADVAGKLIIKVNVASGLPGGAITIGEYAGNLPGLLSYTGLAWNENSVNSSLISQMYWGAWSNEYMRNVDGNITSLDSNSLYWNYTVANRTKEDTSTTAGMPSYADRKASIGTILTNSQEIYNLGTHNVWFYVGAGGNQTNSTTDNTNAGTAQAFAKEMNPWILTQLENKIEGSDFSPFGIVMCNYITDPDNDTYKGSDIIDNIVRMNRLFRLNRDETKPAWPNDGGTTPANSPENYSASHANGGDAWTVQ